MCWDCRQYSTTVGKTGASTYPHRAYFPVEEDRLLTKKSMKYMGGLLVISAK